MADLKKPSFITRLSLFPIIVVVLSVSDLSFLFIFCPLLLGFVTCLNKLLCANIHLFHIFYLQCVSSCCVYLLFSLCIISVSCKFASVRVCFCQASASELLPNYAFLSILSFLVNLRVCVRVCVCSRRVGRYWMLTLFPLITQQRSPLIVSAFMHLMSLNIQQQEERPEQSRSLDER